MPIISKALKQDLILIKVKVPVEVKNEIQKYCEWANIGDISYFLSEAAKYVLSKDKDWKEACNKKQAAS